MSPGRPQAEAARLGLAALARAAAEVPLREALLRLADLGCGNGENSVAPARTVVEQWRRRSAAPIEVVHSDLATTDFAAVRSHAEAYAGEGVRTAVRAGTFYEPLFEPASVELVWSSTATHWLSRLPGPPPSPRSTLSQQVWREQARLDWERWLACRAVELVPGGQIVMVGSGADRFGRVLAEGLLTLVAECLPGLCVASYPRRVEEWTAPLGETWRLVEASEPEMADPYWEELQATGEREVYADRVRQFVRTWVGQDPGEEFRARVLAEPERARCRWWVTVLRLELSSSASRPECR